MDAPALPDDPREWPTDPFGLLGVPRSVGETELKRAYTRLIRKYKPEHAPEEFRRIREAYEAAVEMSRWYRDAPPVSDPTLTPPFEPPGPFNTGNSHAPSEPSPNDRPAEVPHETQIDPPVRRSRIDPVEDAWAAAVAGDWATAYTALVALADADPGRADLTLRLYWLLALRPTLDADRSRHDWLAAALTRARLAGPAVELYARELAADPRALATPYLRLLERADVPADRVLAVARLRLEAAEQRWAAVEVDLAVLARRADELDEAAWLRYLTDVSARAAFAQTPAAVAQTPVAARCAALLAGLKHLERATVGRSIASTSNRPPRGCGGRRQWWPTRSAGPSPSRGRVATGASRGPRPAPGPRPIRSRPCGSAIRRHAKGWPSWPRSPGWWTRGAAPSRPLPITRPN
ncbi:J domain-containing protein [Frigoriglobus tundricola]|uniref:J domain-containing protein n=1 Tax=Frigoriglobus tundricola TaxID=2774151 RepID=A0A6M5YPA7_9BACT|nr:J domain-containing protein [Frigoriglobus tundricola]QJW95808.1 hypothetical protein FTUN_3362 [Frigoriglobus tundricola]